MSAGADMCPCPKSLSTSTAIGAWEEGPTRVSIPQPGIVEEANSGEREQPVPAEERNPSEGFDRDDELTNEHSLNALAKGLANDAIPRGRALRLTGAAFLGTALGVFGFASPSEARRRKRRRASCSFCGIAPGLSPICPVGYLCNIVAAGIGCCRPITL